MKIESKYTGSQVFWLLCIVFFVLACAASCKGKKEETPVMPPLTSPLSQSFIGFGVVNVSYTRVTAQPGETNAEENASGGYLRRGSVVSILQRRIVKEQEKSESWVLADDAVYRDSVHPQDETDPTGGTRGWLRETLVDIYDTELQARTASDSMGK